MASNGVKRKSAPAGKASFDGKSKKAKFDSSKKKAEPVESPESDEDVDDSSDSDDGGVQLNPRDRAQQAQAKGKKDGANGADKNKSFERGKDLEMHRCKLAITC